MSDPILVRGAISSGVAWSRTLVPLGVILAAVLLWLAPPPFGIILGLIFGIAWISLEIYAARQRSRQLWIRDTGDGFDLIDRTGERHFPDSQTCSISLKTEAVYSNGVQKGNRRIFTVWSDLEPDPIPMESKLKLQQPDPLAPTINRIIEVFQKRTQSDLEQGEILAGAGWRLDSTTLTWGKGDARDSIPRADVSACEEFDGQICVWRKGQDEAIAKFKVGTRNVCLLPILLHVAANADAIAAPGDQTGLGRILFERKPGVGTRIAVCCLGLFLLLLGGSFVLAGIFVNQEIIMVLVGGAMVLGGFACGIASYAMRFQSFRCHERGVVQTGMRRRSELKYEDTGAFTYSATRQYHNGAYVGTAIAMHFTPLPGTNAPKISYSTNIKNEDAAIEELRNFISRAIAGRMAKRLAEGQEVPWTPNLTFVTDGIRYRPPGFIGRKDAKHLAYYDYGGCTLELGVFYLFQKGEKKAITNEQAAAANFYPGFFLLMMMQEPG
ncbi:MAG: hypothetical protein JWM11_3299 [Planctomycetaceae bacterium]|nr:hypothetical protein [Planctomycetaceae bacterium]